MAKPVLPRRACPSVWVLSLIPVSDWALACGLFVLVAMWVLHRLRVRQVARSLNAQFDQRLAERTRMTRDLHDRLLQTVQGSKMVADNALDHPDDAGGVLRALKQVSIWLGQATVEGRAAVNALPPATTDTNDLAAALRRAIEDCRRLGAVEGSLSVSGEPRELDAVVRDEVYRIAYEAIRNACTHSGGTRLDVVLSYGHDLTVRIADNGGGIDPAAVERKEGHVGMQAMRERAALVGAMLTIANGPIAGTDVMVTVPGRVVFRKP